MDLDRQDEIESPVIEDFLDCDQLFSDSDGDSSGSPPPKKTPGRLHIPVDMSSTQYMTSGAHHPERSQMDGLPICTSGPQTGAYHSGELDPYSAVSGVSSFNYPAAADPSLLTPASSSGSPPLPHKQSVKPMRNYHQSTLPSQAPTPPDSSRMYGYNGYDMASSSQSPSPLTVNPAVTESGGFMPPYMAHSPPISHHPSSPRTEIPPPINPYLGHYTVSGPNEAEVTPHSLQDYHPYGVEVAPEAYLAQQRQQQQQHQQHHVSAGSPPVHQRMPSDGGATPDLSQPHPAQFRPHQVGAVEDLRDPGLLLGPPYPPAGALSPGRRAQTRRKPAPGRKPSRTPPKTAAATATTTTTTLVGSAGANSQLQPSEDEEEELTLRDDAPEDDKYLFQLRKEFISEKGKGMWEEMKAKYSEKHQGNWEKAALQMKVSRAVARYGVWPAKEIERLKEAFEYFEEMRYQFILARMKENGGCRVWDWKKPHIIAMLVKLGLEEPTVNEKTGTRRRRQKAAARRQGSPQVGVAAAAAAAAAAAGGAHPAMGDWSAGLGLHHPMYHSHAHHVAAGAAAMVTEDFGGPPQLSPKQEEDLINEVFRDVRPERDLSSDDGMEGLSYGPNNGDAGADRRPSTAAAAAGTAGAGAGAPQSELNHNHNHHHHHHHHHHQGSTRVARQTCDQQLLQHPAPHPAPPSQMTENPYAPQ
ncbi:hypothetical protein MYCTH_2294350 [Thermothelomyces thermophilus ATCC 42464]|uniref:Myb-like domain-containing protein n=1 Tax=Thermothelomyces thermophilus (strain ATCC 42464 / BCRC 31852 / DSM 1799) TaxID=573729 RepID=G2Q0W1_THET4|nr:uncharacterized protein MYCTH_2294350 [Thermothelomyces thermophilus ATCC 42464]AEO53261.1 hypothetical protein MYCTH_2294350 [Thermothelomyces thermophilus ATCC 42464]